MNIRTIKITERASYNYQVSEWTYEVELADNEDPTEATNYIRNLAISNATTDVKALANNFPNNTNSVGNVSQQPRQSYGNAPKQGYNTAPKQQYQRTPYHQNTNQYNNQQKPASDAQIAYFRQLAEQLGYDPNSYPRTSAECTQAIKSRKNELGLE